MTPIQVPLTARVRQPVATFVQSPSDPNADVCTQPVLLTLVKRKAVSEVFPCRRQYRDHVS